MQVKVYGESNFKALLPGDDSSDPNWLQISNQWKGTVKSGAHGVKETAVPQIASIKAFDPVTGLKGYHHTNAGLVLRDTLAFDQLGLPVILPPGTVSEKTMYDAREKKNVKVTEVNIGLLNISGRFPPNGLIYAYRTDASAVQPNGIRLTNGATLAAPLTLVTEDPVYIRGDFNTVNKKGASVMADAVNLLSNAWNDSKTAGTLPSANQTTYNVTMITGNVPTPDGISSYAEYSGGFENLPRLHEKWTGVQNVISGSFINIFTSEIAKSLWKVGGDVYEAPIRNWSFDPSLQDFSKMPPFTPNAIYFERVLWDDGSPSLLPSP